MSLATYQKKRKFDKTSEPSGKVAHSSNQLRFVIQKHDASHLHYDFRLELDGVLKSWAVPKGPSLNPNDKRLAMAVEDHPLDYRTFEGVIPKGNYGAGEVIVWDEGTYFIDPKASRTENETKIRQALKKGKLTFTLNGIKLKGEFSLLKMHGREENSWLLVKTDDDTASEETDIREMMQSVRSDLHLSRDKDADPPPLPEATSPAVKADIKHAPAEKIPRPVSPMLATLVDKPFDQTNWLFEIKWDGYRAIAEIENGKINLYSRNQKSFVLKFAPIVDALKAIHQPAILDGEIVAVDQNGKASFQMLQDYQANQHALVYYVFDLLALDGKDLRELPLKERKAILKSILPDVPDIRFSDHVETQGTTFFDLAVKEGLEGIMAKDANSPYVSGKRTSYWLKIKTHQRQEVVVAGYTEPRGSRKHIGALILGVYDKNDKLQYIGHTGTGFDTTVLTNLKKVLDPLVTNTCPFEKKPKTNAPVHWVQPKLVGEVKF